MRHWATREGTPPIGTLVWVDYMWGTKHGGLWVICAYAGSNYPDWYYLKSLATGVEWDCMRRDFTIHEPLTVTVNEGARG